MNKAVPFAAKVTCIIILLILIAPASLCRQIRARVDVLVPVPPSPVRSDGYYHLAYELHVTNFGDQELNLWRLEVTGDDPAAFPLGSYEGPDLVERIARPGQPGLADKRRIAPGTRAVVYVWISIDARSSLPTALTHRLTFTSGQSATSVVEIVEEIPKLKLAPPPLVISAPLRGSQWLAANGPSNSSLHRRSLVAIEGRAALAQRFATDWIRLGDDGKSWREDRSRNSNYHAYGAEVLAVADGTVAATSDGLPDNKPGARFLPTESDTVAGNYVIVDLGGDRFAFYGHLQPGLRVKAGEKVERGRVLGLVGNSGDSLEPALHFQITDSSSPLRAEGLPYAIDAFELQGRGWGWRPFQAPAEERRGEIPMQNAIVKFKEKPPRQTAQQSALIPEARPEDVASIETILIALYDTISGPAGKKRDWARFRSLFAPGARLIPTSTRPTGGFEARSDDVEGYVTASSAYLEKNGFFEREIARRVETFGHIAQAFSTYESRHKAEDPKPFARGINSIQLMNDGKRWWIVTVFWEEETRETPLPKKYTKR
jgi:murein DD-endopeptidase MepM/ murein hydrolase activator NlpD